MPMGDTIETVFAQLFLLICQYLRSSDLCEEHSACQTRTRRLVLAEQSDPLFEPASLLTKTPTPSTEDPAQVDLLQKYQEGVERLSQQNRVIKICIDAGFLKTVEVGQQFMTKDTDEFFQFAEPVTCREYTLPRNEKSTDPKCWIRGNTKIGPVLEVTTSYMQCEYGVKISFLICKPRQFSLVGQNFSWIEQVGHRLDRQADQRLKQNQEDPPLLAHLQELYLLVKEYGLILKQELNPIKHTQWQKD